MNYERLNYRVYYTGAENLTDGVSPSEL